MPDDLVPLYEIALKFRRSPECIRLWITRGILHNGQRVKLKGTKVGGSWLVSEAELYRWIFDTSQNDSDAA